jgi:putative lipoprotein
MLSRFAELLLFGVAPLLIGLVMMPTPSSAAQKTVKGEVLYRERIALPPDAVVNVQLLDVSLADAPAKVIVEQTLKPTGRQVPIPFKLTFDAAVIKSGRTYALQARITVGDTLWFITDTRHAIDPLAVGDRQTVIVTMVRHSQAPSDEAIFDRTWLAENIGDPKVTDKA